MAEALKGWFPVVIQSIECFFSTEDIRSGQRWNAEINTRLADTDFGVLCVTPENMDAQWLNFEAGALSKRIQESRVVPVTLGFPPKNVIDGPFKQFNGVEANEAGIRKLVTDLAEASNSNFDVQAVFDMWWPTLQAKLEAIPESPDDVTLPGPPDSAELLNEILGVVRGIAREQVAARGDWLSTALDDPLIQRRLAKVYAQARHPSRVSSPLSDAETALFELLADRQRHESRSEIKGEEARREAMLDEAEQELDDEEAV